MNNTTIYKKLLYECLYAGVKLPGIAGEITLNGIRLDPYEQLEGTSEKYIKAELNWYLSQDRCIKGHEGIENNPIWTRCATEHGMVNSNYGWCIFSKDNCLQFNHARQALRNDKYTRQAILVYTRPDIQIEHNDGFHASHDMICTCYTQFTIRPDMDGDRLYLHVYMRSNDAWYGFRNDLAWQQYVYDKMFQELNSNNNMDILKGKIFWYATSWHIYKRDEDKIHKYLNT